MGMVSCLGAAVFVGTFSLPTIAPRISGDKIEQAFVTGLVLFMIGSVIDLLGKTTTIHHRKEGKTRLRQRNH